MLVHKVPEDKVAGAESLEVASKCQEFPDGSGSHSSELFFHFFAAVVVFIVAVVVEKVDKLNEFQLMVNPISFFLLY